MTLAFDPTPKWRPAINQLPLLRVENDVACTVCGCVCDDLTLHFHDQQLVRVERACSLAEPWFEALRQATPATSIATIQGEPASYQDAISAAATLLSHSHAPLIYGLSRSSSPGQRAAVELLRESP